MKGTSAPVPVAFVLTQNASLLMAHEKGIALATKKYISLYLNMQAAADKFYPLK
jgi:hypothetical protein